MPNLSISGNVATGLMAAALGLATLGALSLIVRDGGASSKGDERATRVAAESSGYREAAARGQRYLDMGRPDLALESVMHVRENGPGAGEAMTVAGIALFQLRDPLGARAALEVALNFQPDQPEAALALASLYVMTGDTVRGLLYLEKAAQAAPDDVRPWVEMGKIHHDLGESTRAAVDFEEALQRESNHSEARVGLIASLLNSDQIEEATPRIAEALEVAPEDAAILGLAARHAFELGRPELAIEYASSSLERDPENVDALLSRARVRHASGELEQALADLERVVASRPNNLGALQLLGKVQIRLGLTEQADETMARHARAHERALRMNELAMEIVTRPDDPELRWEMGRLALEGKSTVLARRCFKAALLLDPQYQPALDSLAKIEDLQTGAEVPPWLVSSAGRPATTLTP